LPSAVSTSFSASTVPNLQLGISGKDLCKPQLNVMTMNFLGAEMIMFAGASIPYPLGR
jgi:hypothetical protein